MEDNEEDDRPKGYVPIEKVADPHGLNPEEALLAKEAKKAGDEFENGETSRHDAPVMGEEDDDMDIEDVGEDQKPEDAEESHGGKMGLHRLGAMQDGFVKGDAFDRGKQPPNKGVPRRRDLPNVQESA